MSLIEMRLLPDDAKLWIYGLDREIDPTLRDKIAGGLRAFVASWRSHGADVEGAFEIVENRFVVLAGRCVDGIAGCSTDGSVAVLRSFEEKYGVNALDRDLVFFRAENGAIDAVGRNRFQEEVDSGRLGNGTTVFDTTLGDVGSYRNRFETRFEDSWHARAFAR